MTDSAKPIIRNHRYQPWPAIAVNIAIVAPLAAGSIWLFDDEAPLIYWLAAFIVIGVTTVLLHRSPLAHPVKYLKLGERMTVYPKDYQLHASAIKRIEFAPDPAEDYVDLAIPMRVCQVTISVHLLLRFRLIVDMHDAARLDDWATCNGIRVESATTTLTQGTRDE